MNTNYKSIIAVVLCATLLVSCGKKKDAPKANPPVVAVVKVVSKDVPFDLEAQAKVVGSLDVKIYAQVGGIIKKRLFSEGEYVEKGKQLFQIDPAIYKAALARANGMLAQAKAELRRATRDFHRINILFKKDAVSLRALDEATSYKEKAEANLAVAKASVQEAQINYDYTKVYAPISGIVGKEVHSVGNLVAPGQAGLLTSMVCVSPLHIEFSVPGDTWASLMSKKMRGIVEVPDISDLKVQILLQDGGIYPETGQVIFMDSGEDLATGSIPMKAAIENKEPVKILLPGQFVRVRISGIKYLNATLIPVKALIQTDKATFVYKLTSGNIVQTVNVKVVDFIKDQVIVTGIKEGDEVISDGIIKARPGMQVSPTEKPIAQKEVK